MGKTVSLLLISIIFIAGGIMHFTHSADLAAITPLPYAVELVWLTGVMEFFFVLFLWLPRYRVTTALWLCIFCLLVLAANINMAIFDLPMFGERVDPLVRWLRIPMQFVLIAWILYAVDPWQAISRKGLSLLYRCDDGLGQR